MMWEQHCWRLYPRTNHHLIVRVCRLMVNARFQIDFIFTRAAATNQVLFDWMVTHINGAQSVARISALLQLMERNLILNSEIRERYAVTIIQHLRRDVQPLYRIFGYHPGGLDQEMWYRTLYRMTLGLTSDGLYHPNPTPIRRLSRTPRQFLLTYPEDYFFVCLSWACQGPRFPPFGYQD